MTTNKGLNYDDFGMKFRKAKTTIKDKEDPTIFYEDKTCMLAGIELRVL